MGYHLTTDGERALPAISFATPKTHTPGSRLQERGQRYYSPSLGRWLSRDPIEEMGGIHLYAFCRNDSVNDADPDGLRTRRRWRDRNFWRGWNLSMFDERGRELLARWLDGSGDNLTVEDGAWGRYMKANDLLPPQLAERLRQDARGRTASGAVNITFHAEIENGYFTGYEMLHGTHAGVGDFQITGNANVGRQLPYTRIDYALKYTWNDIIDPNPRYPGDVVGSRILNLFYDPDDYEVHIGWHADSVVLKCGDEIRLEYYYPFED